MASPPVSVDALVAAFERQIGACEVLGSPWTAAVLQVARDDLAADGPTRALYADYRLPPHPSAAPLRLAGGLNALIAAQVPESTQALAALHPSVRQDGQLAPSFPGAVRDAIAGERDTLLGFLDRPVQTNEVQRCGALVPGLFEIVQRTGRPLELFEIGASGGLNLLWDRYACRFGDRTFGAPADVAKPVRIEPVWSGAACPAAEAIRVLGRRGVDLTPLDLRDPEVMRRGRAYVWPDQRQRLASFDAAVAVLRASDVVVEAGNATHWLPSALATRATDACAVVMHSVMWQYMPPEDRAGVEASIRAAAASATSVSPLAWLRFEPRRDSRACELTLDLWEGEKAPPRRERLAWTHPHGLRVHWLAADAPDRRALASPFEEDLRLG